MDPAQTTTAPTLTDPEQIGKVLKRLVEAAINDRKEWLKQGQDINRYTTSADYDFEYQEYPGETSFKARVNKAAEFQQTLGPYLYPQNPDASVNSESWATAWAQKRHQIEEQYADYAARVGNLATHMRRTVASALIFGRAPLWTGFNQKRKIVQSLSDVAENYLNDPDAKVEEEVNWQGRIRIKPRWELLQTYRDQKAVIERLPAYSMTPSEKQMQHRDPASQLVKYTEIWMGVGIDNYAPSLGLAEADTIGDVNAKQKYCVADGHVLHAGDWEIPFFLIDEWPGTPLDLLEKPGCLYPYQPMEPGIGHLRAMNWLYTTFISKYTFMSRTPFAVMTINGQKIEKDQVLKILQGEQLDVLEVKINGNESIKLSDLFQRIDWGDPVPGFERIWALCDQEFKSSTGLTEVLSTGMTPTQIRSAKAADLIESRSTNRVDAMRESTLKFLERIFRKTLFGARFLEGSADIANLFGPEAGKLWGELGSPEQVAQEKQVRDGIGQQMAQQGMPPEQIDQMMGPPQLVDMDQWTTEADRTVDAGSMRRLDIDSQVQNLNVALNQLGPAVVNIPGGAEFVAALAGEFTRINRFSPEMQAAAANMLSTIKQQAAMAAAMPPPPPPGQAAPNPPKGPQTGPQGGGQP